MNYPQGYNTTPYMTGDTLFLNIDGVEHGNQPLKSRKSGRSLRQGGSLLKTAPASSVLSQTTGIRLWRLPSRNLLPSVPPIVHLTARKIAAAGQSHLHPRE